MRKVGMGGGYLTSGQVARLLGVSKRTVLRAAACGELRVAHRMPGGAQRFLEPDIARYARLLAARRSPTTPPPAVVAAEAGPEGLAGSAPEAGDWAEALVADTLALVADGLHACAVCLASAAGGAWVIEQIHDRAGLRLRRGDPLPGGEAVGAALRDGRAPAVLVGDLRSDARFAGAAQSVVALSAVALGLPGGPAWRALCALHADPRPAGEADVALLQVAGRLVLQAEEATVLRRAERRAADRLAWLHGALRTSEGGFRLLFAANPVPMWVYDRQSLRFLEVNEAAMAHYGYSRQEFLALRLPDISPEESMPRSLGSGGGQRRHRLKDGRTIDVEIAVHALPFGGREAELVSVFDITERKRAEAALRASEQLLRAVVANAPVMIWAVDAQGVFTLCEGLGLYQVGYEPRTLVGSSIWDVLRPVPEVAADVRRAFAGEEVVTVTRTLGRVIETRYARLLQPDGATGLVGVGTDVTDRARAAEQQARLAAIVEHSEDAIIGKDLDGIIESWNPGAVRLYGYVPEEAIGRPIGLIAPPDRPDEIPELLELLGRGELIAPYETVQRRKDGRLVEISLSISPIKDEEGTVIGAASIARDITERKHAQREAERARRVAEELARVRQQQAEEARALARLRDDFVAAVTHELRTPLTAIVGFGELLQAHWDQFGDEQRLRRIGQMVQAAYRQQRLVEDLLLASGMGSHAAVPRCEALLLGRLVDRAVAEVRRSYPEQQIAALGPTYLRVLVDGVQAVQVLVSLLDNAAKCSPEGCLIGLTWGEEESMAVVRVVDQGGGVPEEMRDRLFTRFGRIPGSAVRGGRVGLGLGLYLSRAWVDGMGGDLDLEATGPAGSTFRVRLPLASVVS